MKRILVLGAGFAGLWAAVGARRKLREMGRERDALVTVVNREPYHNIRVRNYEPDLSDICIPLSDVLDPIGVETILGEATAVNTDSHCVSVRTEQGEAVIGYDALVLALGSALVKPPILGLTEHGFDVDTFPAALAMNAHLAGLPLRHEPGRATVVIVGAGLTGLEVATEMPGRLTTLFGKNHPARVILIDRNPYVGSDMGEAARPVIEQALDKLRIERITGVTVQAIEPDKLILSNGKVIATSTVIWCGGMRANPLAASLGVRTDQLGRVSVNAFMQVDGLSDVFAAGDVASAMVDDAHCSIMSCQHGRPMGRYAGHNVAAHLFKKSMLPLSVGWYATVVDLGPAGAIYTSGFERSVFATGASAKNTKEVINRQRICPPRNRNPDDILAAAAPTVQAPPALTKPGISEMAEASY